MGTTTHRGSRAPVLERVEDAKEAMATLEPSPALGHRLRASLAERERGPTAPRWAWAAVLAAGIVVGWWLRPMPPAGGPGPDPAQGGVVASTLPHGVELVSPACAIEPMRDDWLWVPARCRLRFASEGTRSEGIELDAWTTTVVRPTPRGLAMAQGLAAFDVDSVAAGAEPVAIDVGSVVVEVIGTRFVIENDERSGHLDLVEGHVVLAQDDRVVEVEEGHRVGWYHGEDGTPARLDAEAKAGPEQPDGSPPGGPPTEPTEDATAPGPGNAARDPATDAEAGTSEAGDSEASGGPTRPTGTGTDGAAELAAALDEVARLRRKQAYDEALTQLAGISQHGRDPATAVVLSYERGTLLEAAGHVEDACAHWRGHRKRFRGIGPSDVDDRLARLGCGD